MKKNYAREFWEQAVIESLAALQYSQDVCAENADLLLTEWRKRWTDDGKARPLPTSRQLAAATSERTQ